MGGNNSVPRSVGDFWLFMGFNRQTVGPTCGLVR
jgi:hypothetical protein